MDAGLQKPCAQTKPMAKREGGGRRFCGKVFAMAAILFCVVAASVRLMASPARGSYPNHPVVLVLPFGAGGIADISMRLLAQQLSPVLNQRVVIENKPGPGGIEAAEAVLSAPHDGYTLLMVGMNYAIATALFNKLPYNILTNFASVSTTAFFNVLIVTRPGSPLKSLQDLIAYAQSHPGKLNIGTMALGSGENLAAQLFLSKAGIRATIVPFRTSPIMANAVMRGDVDVAFEFYAALHGLLSAHKIIPLASSGAHRTAYLPKVPTVMEEGIKDYDVASWNGISVPTGTPESVIATINAAVKKVIPEPVIQTRSRQMGLQMRWSTHAAMSARLNADISTWSAVIGKAGIPKRN